MYTVALIQSVDTVGQAVPLSHGKSCPIHSEGRPPFTRGVVPQTWLLEWFECPRGPSHQLSALVEGGDRVVHHADVIITGGGGHVGGGGGEIGAPLPPGGKCCPPPPDLPPSFAFSFLPAELEGESGERISLLEFNLY